MAKERISEIKLKQKEKCMSAENSISDLLCFAGDLDITIMLDEMK